MKNPSWKLEFRIIPLMESRKDILQRAKRFLS